MKREERDPSQGDIPSTDLPLVWMVLGDASMLVHGAVSDIAEKALQGGLASFNRAEGSAESGSVGALLLQAQTPPMLGPRRVVVVRDMEKARVADLDALLRYVASPSPTTVLILTGTSTPPAEEGVDRGKRLQNAVQKSGRLLRFKTEDQDPVRFLVRRVQDAGCRIRESEARLLVETVGKDLGLLAAEVDKLVTFLGGQGEITADVISEVCSLLAEAVVWDLTDAIMRRDADKALAITTRMVEDGEAPQKILALVQWKVRQMLSLQQCDREGRDPFKEGIRMPSPQLAALRASLKARPLRPDHTTEWLARAGRQMHGHRAGERRILEALVLRLVSG